MDKYEYTIKSDKIKKLAERKDYETAAKIADTIDWERIRNVKMLSTVSLVYEKMERYDDAKDILLLAYECAPVGRRFLYKLTELAIRQGQFKEAEDYLKEFAAASPQDPSRLILRYEPAQAMGEPPERLITILEAYQKREFEEHWTYELASLYYRVGKNEECIKLCDEIVLWFGVGSYVDKAMELKQRIAPLTPEQIEKRENRDKYLRRLEDVKREFEEKNQRLEEESAKQAEQTAAAEMAAGGEMAAAAEEPVLTSEPTEAPQAFEAGHFAAEAWEGKAAEESSRQDDMAALEAARLQAEMEASLAREIETAAMSASIDEAMLRQTAATMETVGAVENDHSEEHERTKVASGSFMSQTKTKEFVRQAAAINEAIEEAQGQPVRHEDVLVKLEARNTEPEEKPAVEIESEVMKPEVCAPENSMPEVSEPKSSAPESPAPESPAPEVSEPESPEVKSVGEEASAPEASEEESAEPEILGEESAPAPEECSVSNEISRRIVRDHYVLIASDNEETGLHECVSYIRRMRELLGRPASQTARISGAKLAHKDMEKTLKKLQGRDLIVTGIAELPDAVLLQTVDVMARDKTESFIALIDTEEEIDRLQRRVAFFADCRVLSCEPKPAVSEAPVPEPEAAQTNEVPAEDAVQNRTPESEAAQTSEVPAEDAVQNRTPESEAAQSSEVPAEDAVQNRTPESEAAQTSEVPDENTRQHRTLAQMVEEALGAGGLEAMNRQAAEREETAEGESVGKDAEWFAAEPEAGQQDFSGETYDDEESSYEEVNEEVPAEEALANASAEASSGEEMTPNEFFEFAVQYAHMLDAIVDDMGGLAIFAAAEQQQQDRIPLTEELAQELIEKAILRAERRSFKSLFSNRYNKEGYLILKEEHFKE